jgi:uncharacterized protein YbjT (DUF2867 family)
MTVGARPRYLYKRESMRANTILVTGATGYVGGRLVPCLLERGHHVRCMVRDPRRLDGYGWRGQVDVVAGDVLEPASLTAALEDVDTAYYLIHSLAGGAHYAALDREGAANFAEASARAGVARIIYLGGLEPSGSRRSEHLASRIQTGDVLRTGTVPVTEFRAAVIVGSGSLSFEIVRYITERVPVMICPRWVTTPTQPIAIRNVLEYLVEALDKPGSAGRIYEIGGTDVLTYEDMFRTYAKIRGLRRPIINLPLLTPRLSSHWVGLFTPITNRIARPLIEGLDNEVVVRDFAALSDFTVRPMSYEAAVRLAVRRFQQGDQETSWHGAISSGLGRRELDGVVEDEYGMISESRSASIARPPMAVYDFVQRLGGETGWLYLNSMWRIRGAIDSLLGGVGLRRGRRSKYSLRVGDAVDWWRVEAAEPGKMLRLRAEMKVPGRAWLQFDIAPETNDASRTVLTQTALFEPRGLGGTIYWYALYPVHKVMFRGMVRAIRDQLECDHLSEGSVKGTSSKKHDRRPV